MALIPGTRYPAQTDVAAEYPQGKARNAGTFGDGTGTPLEKDWVNDVWGFLQALLANAAITPSGDPDEVGASDYLDAVSFIAETEGAAAAASATSRLRAIQLCKPRLISGVTLSVVGSLQVVSLGRGFPLIGGSAHSGGVPLIVDGGDLSLGGVIASITGAVGGAAYDPTGGRIVLVGVGGNRSAYSDDGGATWSAGGDLGGSGTGLIWNPTYSRFQALYSNHARFSSNAVAWTDVALNNVGRGIGMLPNGNTYVLSGAGPTAISVSTNGGTSWAAAGAVPNAADMTDRGTIAGAGIDYVYHAGVRASTDGLVQIARSTDGTTWTTVAEFAKINGLSFGVIAGIRQCPDTGTLFVFVGIGAANMGAIYASVDQGATWSEPLFVYGSYPVSGLSAAHGRIFLTGNNGFIYGSDGVGWL
jgi:hypothetical protein